MQNDFREVVISTARSCCCPRRNTELNQHTQTHLELLLKRHNSHEKGICDNFRRFELCFGVLNNRSNFREQDPTLPVSSQPLS